MGGAWCSGGLVEEDGMRRISFRLTQPQFMDGSKDVTRRIGWLKLKAGDHLLAVDQVMGFRKGEKATILGEIEVISVRRERLSRITDEDVEREGFPGKSSLWFCAMFTKAMRCEIYVDVTRIEFRKVGGGVDR